MLRANSTCFAVRLPSGLSASISVRISRLFSGVRSSCDMLARNCDLYREASVELLGLLLQGPPRPLDLAILGLDLRLLLGEQLRLLLQLLVGLLELLALLLQQFL